MKRNLIGTMMGEHVVKSGEMLRGMVQTKPRQRFQALFYLLADLDFAAEMMDEMNLWAVDSDGVADKANRRWMLAAAEPIIDGTYEPPVPHQRAMQRLIDGRERATLQRAIASAAKVSLEMDRRVMQENTDALKAKYAGDKLGWLHRATQVSTRQQQQPVIAGNLVINAGNPARKAAKPPRIDKLNTKRLAEVIDAEVKVID